MSELESVTIGAQMCDGIECNTEYVELNDTFDLTHQAHVNLQSDVCSDGLCSIEWKPSRDSAA
ncbi:MAG: hypothetical protein JST89_18315 [Cyanobacteria bacterium SZAS-4]|nr:hypothetical protein [Cyanobacteria bacterium SZAS-4]